MTTFRYQEQFAAELAEQWINGNREHVRTKIRGLKNKAQAAYMAIEVYANLAHDSREEARAFSWFMHPNER